jgi:hypothetical protein
MGGLCVLCVSESQRVGILKAGLGEVGPLWAGGEDFEMSISGFWVRSELDRGMRSVVVRYGSMCSLGFVRATQSDDCGMESRGRYDGVADMERQELDEMQIVCA